LIGNNNKYKIGGLYLECLLEKNKARNLAPIAAEILYQSRRVGKDWSGKRDRCLQIVLLFRFKKKVLPILEVTPF